MAKSALSWKHRRALLDTARIAPETLAKAGRELFDHGRLAEAAEFFRQAGNQEGLKAVLAQAVLDGDYFLLRLASQYLGEEPKAEDLAALAEKAEAAGLLASAAKARERLSQSAGEPSPGEGGQSQSQGESQGQA
jgi:hypothetical protein